MKNKEMVGIALNGLTLPHFCACPKHSDGQQCHQCQQNKHSPLTEHKKDHSI
jgi:hypothetical protein